MILMLRHSGGRQRREFAGHEPAPFQRLLGPLHLSSFPYHQRRPGRSLLDNNATLFPSTNGELTVTTTVPAGTPPAMPPAGSFEGNGFALAMSDSGATRWMAGATDFATDHARSRSN